MKRYAAIVITALLLCSNVAYAAELPAEKELSEAAGSGQGAGEAKEQPGESREKPSENEEAKEQPKEEKGPETGAKEEAEEEEGPEAGAAEETKEQPLETQEPKTEGGAQTEAESASETEAQTVATTGAAEGEEDGEYVGRDVTELEEELADQPLEIIKKYEYSDQWEEDTVISHTMELKDDGSGEYRLVLVVSLGLEETATETETALDLTSSFGLLAGGGNTVPVDGSFSDWDNVPSSYEYNYDNSNACWEHGEWVDGQKYTTPEGTYDANVRHEMKMVCDGEYVYLYIKYAKIYGAGFNGEDYQFYIDGNMAAFQVNYAGGGTITNQIYDGDPGLYEVDVLHRNSDMSYSNADGSKAYLYVSPDGYNSQLEMKIPISTMQQQNPDISTDTIGTVEFFTPNLMYRHLNAAGADTSPYAGAAVTLLFVPASCAGIKYFGRKKRFA